MKTINTPCISLTASGNCKAKFTADPHVHACYYNPNENKTFAFIKTPAYNRQSRREALNTIQLYFHRKGLRGIRAEYHSEGCEIIEYWKDLALTN